MSCKILRFVVCSCLVTIGLAYATGGVMTGAGTAADPFLVADYADLKAVGVGTTYRLSSVYRVMADIDASPSATENGDSGFVPIGTNASRFTGKFHGCGHVINRLHINRPLTSYIGLFGATSGSTIDSLGLVDNTISGPSFIGGIAGRSSSSSIISNCYNSGTVSGSTNVGGIAGYNDSCTINNCNNIGRVSGYSRVGGIAGSNTYCTISNSKNTGSVASSSNFAGGIAGSNTYCTISNSKNTGSVASSSNFAGGIAGYNTYCTISNCNNTGSVTGISRVGGIAGYNYNNASIIRNCYNTGSVSGDSLVGGIAGYNEYYSAISNCYNTGSVSSSSNFVGGIAGYNYEGITISNCYNTGSVSGDSLVGGIAGDLFGDITYCYNTGSVSGSSNYAGGIVGYTYFGTIPYCYCDTQTSGQSCAWGGTELATAEMKNSSNLSNLDFGSTWTIRADSTYPGLQVVSDNAPFAFADAFISATRTFALSQLLLNDYDIETVQQYLILKVQSASAGTTDSISTLLFPSGIANGTIDTVKYRIGEIRSTVGDTLWGNIAKALVTLDTITTAVITPNTEPSVATGFKYYSDHSATVAFTLSSPSIVSLKIYDLRGREVATLVNDEQLGAGSFTRQWNTGICSSGLYFCRIQAGPTTLMKKIWR